MTNEEFGEFYNQNYRPMPEDFYPEIESWWDEDGVLWRRIGNLGYIEGHDLPPTTHNRAQGDQVLREMEWNRLEMARISKLAGIE